MSSLKNGFCFSLGKFLFKVLIGILLFLFFQILFTDFDYHNILLKDVYAITPNNWYDAKLDLTPVYMRDIANHTTLDNGGSLNLSNYENIPAVIFNGHNINSSRFTFQVPYMQIDYAYEVDIYVCGSGTYPQFTMPYSLDYLSQSINNNRIFNGSIQYEYLSGVIGDGSVGSTFSSCRVYSFYLYGQSGIWLSMPITNNYDGFYYLGYKFYNLGIAKNSILSAISSSQSGVISNINGLSSQMSNMQSQLHNDANDIYANVNANTDIINSNLNRQSTNIQNNQNSNNQQLISNQNSNNQQLISNNNSNFNMLNSNITDDNIDNSQTSNIFNNDIFSEEVDLIQVATLPIDFLQSISSSTCVPLSFTMPIVHTQVTLPCMSVIYQTYFSDILNIYRIITTGLIVYYCLLSIIKTVEKLLDPTVATVEVYDL